MNKDQIFDRRFEARPLLDRKTEDCPCGMGPRADEETRRQNAETAAKLEAEGKSPISPIWFDLAFAGSCMWHHDWRSQYPPTWRDLTHQLNRLALEIEEIIRSKQPARALKKAMEANYLWDFVESWRDLGWLSPRDYTPRAFPELGDYSPAAIANARRKRERSFRKLFTSSGAKPPSRDQITRLSARRISRKTDE